MPYIDQNTRNLSGGYLAPLLATGAPAAPHASAKGTYTLASSSTYYVPLRAADVETLGAHLTTYTAGLVLTSVTVEVCSHSSPVDDLSTTAGEWVQWNPPGAYVPVTGSGWSSIGATVASTGSALGGAAFDFSDVGQRRLRLKLVVGGTGGDVRLSVSRK